VQRGLTSSIPAERSPGTRAVWVAITATATVTTGLYWTLHMQPEVPPPPYRPAISDVFPDLDFAGASPGSAAATVYSGYGRLPPTWGGHAKSRYCAAFRYDRGASDVTLTLLVDSELIHERWLSAADEPPSACAGLPIDRVDLTGWRAARAVP
jgi:hypothetical protein